MITLWSGYYWFPFTDEKTDRLGNFPKVVGLVSDTIIKTEAFRSASRQAFPRAVYVAPLLPVPRSSLDTHFLLILLSVEKGMWFYSLRYRWWVQLVVIFPLISYLIHSHSSSLWTWDIAVWHVTTASEDKLWAGRLCYCVSHLFNNFSLNFPSCEMEIMLSLYCLPLGRLDPRTHAKHLTQPWHTFLGDSYWLPFAAETNYHQFPSLRQYKFII